MSLSSCIKCWETICVCGHKYKSWSQEEIQQQIEMLLRVLEEKRAEADATGVSDIPNNPLR